MWRAGEMFPMRLLGMGLFLAWEILTSPFERAFGVPGGGVRLLASVPADQAGPLLSALLTAALLAGAALLERARGGLACGGGVRPAAACAACAVGSAALTPLGAVADGSAGAAVGTALCVCSIALRAVADAGLFLLWNAQLSRHGARTAWVAYAGSFALASSVYFVVSAAGSVALAVGVVALPVASALLLAASASLPQEGSAEPAGAVAWGSRGARWC